jgi:hypothetical protein
MNSSVVVDGEASETESEYSDSDEEFSECVNNPSVKETEISPAPHENAPEAASDTLLSPLPSATPAPDPESVSEVNSVTSQSSVPLPPPSPSLTLFEENLRERNAVFSNQMSSLVGGYFDKVLHRIKFLNTDCRNLQVSVERVTTDFKCTKSNLTRGLNQLDAVLALPLLPDR